MQSGASGFVSNLSPPGCATLANALLFKCRWLPVEKGESLVSGGLKRITVQWIPILKFLFWRLHASEAVYLPVSPSLLAMLDSDPSSLPCIRVCMCACQHSPFCSYRIGRAQATSKFKFKGNLLLPQAAVEGPVPLDIWGWVGS